MPIPSAITFRADLAIGASAVDVLADNAQALLKEPAYVMIFLNRESVDVAVQCKIGDVEVVPLGPCPINATIGDTPLFPDDLILPTLGNAGDRVQILGTNVNAAAQELGVIVRIVAIRDALTMPALVQMG